MDVQYLKNVLKYAASALLSVILIAYILYHMSGGFSQDIVTETAALTTKEETLTIRSSIMRNEKILYSPFSGDINYLFSDGDKVAIGTKVAEVYPSGGDAEMRKSIIALDRKIRILEQSESYVYASLSDTASTDRLIWKDLYSFMESADSGSVSSVSAISDDLLIQLNRRKIIVGSVRNYSAQLETLKAEKNALMANFPAGASEVVTESAGYFFSAVDGFENIFSSADIAAMTLGDYRAMCLKSAEDLSRGGFAVGKLVTDYRWYTACEVASDELHNFDTGKYYDVKFPYNGGASINMYLYRILSDVGSDTSVLIFRTDILPEGFSYLRNQTVQVVKSSFTGYRVPVSAVRIVDGVKGVYILRGSKVLFRKIEPLFEYDGYFIVKERDEDAEDRASWLAKNDFVIVKGKDLYDGKIVN